MQFGSLKNNRGRDGTTLVELLVVTTLISMLLLIVGTVAIHLRQWDRKVRDHSEHGNRLASLADTIRADVRRATSVTLPETKIVAIAGPGGREIRYELESGGCRRVLKTPGESSPKTETFPIGPADAWKLETIATGRRPAYAISLERSESDKVISQSTSFYVYAALGSDLP